MSSETQPLLPLINRSSYTQPGSAVRGEEDVSLQVRDGRDEDSRRALPADLSAPSTSSSSSSSSSSAPVPLSSSHHPQLHAGHRSPRRSFHRIAVRHPTALESCSGCVLSFARFVGSCRWLWVTSSVYFLCHIAVSLYTLFSYYTEHCTYDYHYLLLVYCLRSLLALRIVYWQTHEDEDVQLRTEPGTFDRFLKNWMDMIALIYAGMWALAPADCLVLAPHQYLVCTAFVTLSYAALGMRLLLHLTLTHMPLSDTLFILLRSLQKNLNAGSAFTGPLTEGAHVVRMSEVAGVSSVVYEGVGVGVGGQWSVEDAMCAICLSGYEVGEDIRVLGCGHHMHSRCVDRWVMEKRRCPLCNQHV